MSSDEIYTLGLFTAGLQPLSTLSLTIRLSSFV